MKKKDGKKVRAALLELSKHENRLVSLLAKTLSHTVIETDLNTGKPENAKIRELIAGLTEQITDGKNSGAAVIEALVSLDFEISKRNSLSVPWATRLAPLAFECAVNAEKVLLQDMLEKDLAMRSPVIHLDDRTILAVPIGKLGRDSILCIVDRILVKAINKRTRRVVLVSVGLDAEDSDACWSILKTELQAHKIKLEIVNEKDG